MRRASVTIGLVALVLLAAAPAALAAPATPVVTGTTPAFAGSEQSPSVKGTVDQANTVSVGVYNTNDCSGGAPTAVGTKAAFTGAGIATPVAATDHVTAYAAKAFDGPNGTGNASACSPIFKLYTQNPAPVITAVGETLSNDASPPVIGTAGTFSSDLRIYDGPNCTGASVHVTRTQFINGYQTVHVQTLNAVNQYSARVVTYVSSVEYPASDCSNNFEYTHDSIPAAVPTILGSTPVSGGNDTTPAIYGTAPAGTTVALCDTSSCFPPTVPLVEGTDTAFASPGLPITVPDDSATEIYAVSLDDAHNISAVSVPFTYITGNPPITTPPAGTTPPAAGTTPPPAGTTPPVAPGKKCRKGFKLKKKDGKKKCVRKKAKRASARSTGAARSATTTGETR